MDDIIISVSDLSELVHQLEEDGMDYVELSVQESFEEEDDDIIPPALFASGFKSSSSDYRIDYDEIVHVSDFN